MRKMCLLFGCVESLLERKVGHERNDDTRKSKLDTLEHMWQAGIQAPDLGYKLLVVFAVAGSFSFV